MKKFDLFNTLENNGYYGTDAGLDISLLEYGLLVKEEGEEFHCIYGIENSEETGDYIKFGHGWITKKDIDGFLDESWFDQDSFFSFTNTKKDEWLKLNYCHKISDLTGYYGYENIMGTEYCPLSLFDIGRLARNIDKKNKSK